MQRITIQNNTRTLYQTVGSETAHAATAKRVWASINSMRMWFGMILSGAKRLHVNAVRILPLVRKVIARPIFAKVINTCCSIPWSQSESMLKNEMCVYVWVCVSVSVWLCVWLACGNACVYA